MDHLIEWTVLIVTILGISIYVYLTWNFNYWKKRGVTGPKPTPLFGNIPNTIKQSRHLICDYDDIYRQNKGKERFVGVYQARNPQLLIIDPKLIRDILIANFKSFHDNEISALTDKVSDKLLSRNPFFLTGDEWKEKRSEITPAFTGSRVKSVYPVILETCRNMTTYIENENKFPPKNGFDAKELASQYTTEVVVNCVYGVEAGAFSNKTSTIREMGRQIFDVSFIANFYIMLITIAPKITAIWRRSFIRPHIEEFFNNLMNSSIEIRKRMHNDRADFLNYLLQLQTKKNLSSLDMAAHTLTFFVDGYETSSAVIMHCLHMTANLGDKLLSKNPFILTGNEWKERRAEITPALTGTRIKAVYPVMLEVCSKMTKYLEKENKVPPKDGFDGREIASKFTAEVVSNCIYGLEAGAFSDERCEIREMGRKILDANFFSNIYFILLTVIPKISMVWKKPLVLPEIEKFFTDLMNSATEIRKKTKNDRADFLNYLLQLQEKKNLTALDMASHTLTFFFDGFETSSVVITHCLHMLGRYKEVQNLLRQEIKNAIAENEEITFEKLNELPYLDQVINETLRLFNPLIFTSKLCTESCEIEKFSGEKVQLKKGDIAVISAYSLHRDEEYYPEPEKFIPERFSPENGGTRKYRDMGVFLPFGDGPRICLGMRFALAQVKACIVEMVQNWEISVNKKTRDDMRMDPKQFIFMIDGGIWLDLKRI